MPPDLLLDHTLAWVGRSGPLKDVNMGGIPVWLAVGRWAHGCWVVGKYTPVFSPGFPYAPERISGFMEAEDPGSLGV